MNDDNGWWLDEYDGPRFWQYVAKSEDRAQADPLDTSVGQCWLWLGGTDRDGYGRFRMGAKMMQAHRIAFLDGGRTNRIPDGHVLDHLCRVPSCVNPAHLEPVTQAENIRRGKQPVVNRAECRNGHPFTEENTVHRKRGNGVVRACRVCLSASKRRSYLRSKATT